MKSHCRKICYHSSRFAKKLLQWWFFFQFAQRNEFLQNRYTSSLLELLWRRFMVLQGKWISVMLHVMSHHVANYVQTSWFLIKIPQSWKVELVWNYYCWCCIAAVSVLWMLWILDILSLPTTLSSFSFFVGMHQVCNCGELCVLTLPEASHFPVLIGLMGEWKNGFTNCHLAWVMTIDK